MKHAPLAYGIRAVGFANGMRCQHAGQWLKNFDHDAYGGQGYGSFTPKASLAKRFASKADALMFWSKQSTVKPLRPDGLPNKPLTALSVEILALP